MSKVTQPACDGIGFIRFHTQHNPNSLVACLLICIVSRTVASDTHMSTHMGKFPEELWLFHLSVHSDLNAPQPHWNKHFLLQLFTWHLSCGLTPAHAPTHLSTGHQDGNSVTFMAFFFSPSSSGSSQICDFSDDE